MPEPDPYQPFDRLLFRVSDESERLPDSLLKNRSDPYRRILPELPVLLPADEYPPLLFAYPVFCCCTVCFAELAQKIRDLFGNIFEPFRQAWELEGKNTIEAAEYAFSSLKTLVESVGASLMEVWTNGTETKTVTLLLEILQNVLLTVGHIADRRNEAWNTGGIGTQIIQNLFDLFNIILEAIREITGAAAEWAATHDFAPLLQSINGLLEALKPLGEWTGNLVTADLKTPTDLLNRFGDWISEHRGIVEAFIVDQTDI